MKLKKYFKYVIFCSTFLSLISSFGCSNDEDDINPLSSRESGLIGTWVLTKITVTDLSGTHVLTPEQAKMLMTMQTNQDKTFLITTTVEGVTETVSGTWSLNGDIVSLTSENETQFIPYTVQGNKFTITIYEAEGDILNSRILEFTKQ